MHQRRLVLVGGGHAHLEVLRDLARHPLHGVDVRLVTPHERHAYSSSMPAVLRGTHPDTQGHFALDVLAQRAGVTLQCATVSAISGGATPRVCIANAWVDAHVLSLDLGSAPRTADVVGAGAHAHHVRSFTAWQALRTAVDALYAANAHANGGAVRHAIHVVGAGAGGVEIALALQARARRDRVAIQVTLLDRNPELAARNGGAAVLRRLLREAGVRCAFGQTVTGVSALDITLSDGRQLESALTVWTAGAAPPLVLRANNALPLSDDGYLHVANTLQAIDGSPVFGAGDCIDIDGYRLAKAGVYAVRQAPVLARNLRIAIDSASGTPTPLVRYRPQRHYLSILDTSDGRALLTWGGYAMHMRWALPFKRWLDARFVARYQ